MVALPGRTWEYIAFNIDVVRLQELNLEWKKNPRPEYTLKTIENMLVQLGNFKPRKMVKKTTASPEDAEFISLDPDRWTVISERPI